MLYTQEDLNGLFDENTRSLVGDLSPNAVLCSIRIWDTNKNLLVSAARFSSEHSPDMPEMEDVIPVEGTVGGDAVRTGKIQEVPDLAKDHRFGNHKITDAGYTSMMAVPVIFKGQAKGVAQVYSKTKGYVFSKKEKQMAMTIANNMAAVLVCKEYAEEVERLQKKEREAAILDLIERHAGAVAHAVKNKTTGIGGFATRIKKQVEKLLADDLTAIGSMAKEQLENIKLCADRIIKGTKEMEQQLKHVLSIGQRPPKLEAVNIHAFLSSLIDNFPKETRDGKEIRIVSDFQAGDNLEIKLDKEQIKELVEELLQNAKDAAAQCSNEVVIGCHTSLYDGKGHHSCCIEFENSGEIPPKTLEKIFDPFFTTKRNGSGLGLFNARVTVKWHGGEIVVKSGKGKTTVRFYLPR